MNRVAEEGGAAYLIDTGNEDIPVGYKKTEVGVIPASWEIRCVGSFAPLQRGFDLVTGEIEDGVYPVVYSNGIGAFHKTHQVRSPGVVTGRSGTIGKVHFITEDYWPHNTTLWVTKFDGAIPKFVYYLFQFVDLSRFASGSGVPTFNRNDAHAHKIAVPTFNEQKRISDVLSDIDNLIEVLERLIAKKQAFKAVTMQQLLSGKARLPQFTLREDGSLKEFTNSELGEIPEDWIILRLGKIASFINGRAYSLNEWETEGIPVIRLQNLTGRGDEYYFSNIELPEKNYCVTGDLLFMWSATFGPVIWQGERAIFHYHIWKVDVNEEFSREFIYYLLCHMTLELKRGSSSGGTMLHVTKGMMEEVQARLPSYEEQLAISAVLKDLDLELEALEGRLSKTRQLKQGMMQQLLTGKIRLLQPAKVRELIDES